MNDDIPWKLINGDALAMLKTLPSDSVDCCVTSPPYYALRDYGTGHWEGGDPNCPHYRTSKYSEATATGHKAMMDNLAGSPEGGIILDPFNGTGTTGVVAIKYGRKYIGIDLSEKYIAMSTRRLEKETEQYNLFDNALETIHVV